MAYGELIGPGVELLDSHEVEVSTGVWPIARRSDAWTTLQLVNFTGLETAHWCEPHSPPKAHVDVPLSFPLEASVEGIWWASPDKALMGLSELPFQEEDGRIKVVLPSLEYWSMLVIETG